VVFVHAVLDRLNVVSQPLERRKRIVAKSLGNVLAAIAISAKRLSPSASMLLGGIASFVGMGLLDLSIYQHSL
jgi:hypothetical protein